MKITYTMTDEDVWNFAKHATYNNSKGKRHILIWFGLIPVLTSTFVFYLTHLKLFALLSFVFLFALAYYSRFPLYKKRILESARSDKSMFKELTLEINKEGISQILHAGTTFYKWISVYTIDMTDKYLFIITGQGRGLIVPKRIFKSEDETIQFYNTATQFIKQAQQC